MARIHMISIIIVALRLCLSDRFALNQVSLIIYSIVKTLFWGKLSLDFFRTHVEFIGIVCLDF